MPKILAKDNDLIRSFSRELLAACKSELDRIVFFGSRAKGLAKPDSDYDLLLVVNHKERALVDKIYSVLTDFCLQHEVDISLKIYAVDDYRKRKEISPFFLRINETGIELWNKTKNK